MNKEKSKISLFIIIKKKKIIYVILARRSLFLEIKLTSIKIENDLNYFKYKEKNY